MMRFTVVTVCYNAGNKLRETVKNILEQKGIAFELLIKDGASKDDSLMKCEEFLVSNGYRKTKQTETENRFEKGDSNSPIVRIVSEPDKGIYDAMNRAVKLARGEYISFMNCGDGYFTPDVLLKTDLKIRESKNRGIYYGDAYFRKAGTVMHMPQKITPSQCYRHIPNHQACFFKRDLWASKQLNPKYRIRADYEFFLYQYFVGKVDPVYLGIVVADYEGGGYSETKENRKRDRYEHKVVTEKYMTKKQIRKEKAFGVLTLQPLRKWIASDSPFSALYDRIRKKMYR